MSDGVPAREALANARSRLLKRGRGAKPDVLLLEGASPPVVVKDYAPRSRAVRHWLAPRLLAREQRVHDALRDHPAVPRVLGSVDELALAFEFRDGEPLTRALGEKLGADRAAQFARDLEAAVAQMHRSGVVHLDLRHRDNILCDAAGRPVLLDFALAMHFRPGSFWYRWYRPTVLIYDAYALSKWRERLRPGAVARRRGPWRRIRSALRRARSR